MATSSLFDQGKKVCVICLCLLMAFPVPPDVLAATLTVDELLGKESLDTSRVSIPVRQPKSEPPIRLEKSTLTRPVERSVPSPDSTVLETDSLNSQEISIEAPAEVTMATSSASSLGSETLSQMSVNHFHVDPISGGGSLALPIVSPIGRGGMKPDLVLSYSPRRGNGPFGTGWDIDFGFIERSTKNGIPKFDDTDTFLCSLGGSAAELVSVGNGRYQSKVEGEFLFIKKDGDTWMVKDRKGRTYFFGLNDVLQDESVVKDGAKIFRWRLSEVRDVSGNFYFIRYLKNGAFEIFYTGEPGTDRAGIDTTSQNFYARITVELENTLRPDRLLNYRSGFEQRMDKRIKAINVYAIGHLQNRYVFDYETSSRSGVSLLKSVTFYGADGETTMPPAIFSYEQNSVGYNLVGIMDNPTTGDRRWSFRYNAGYDRGHENYGPVPPAHMLPLSSPIVAASWGKAGSWTQDNYGRINLNGRPDTGYYFSTYFYVRNSTTINLSYEAYQWNPGFWLNGNYSKTVGAKWSLKPGYNLLEYTDYHQHDYFTSKFLTKISDQVDLMNSAQVILPQLSGDFNGDGVADVATFFPESGKVKVALSTGGAFLPKEEWASGLPSDSRPVLGDFNGDGRIDIAFVYPSNGNVEVALSDGTKFIRSGIWIFGFSVNDPVSAGDFNGDGYADIVSFFISGSDQKAKIAMNTRSGAFTLLSGINPVAGAQADTVFMTDFNGDGLADFGSFNKSTGSWRAYLNTGGPDKSFLRLADIAGFGINKIMAVADFNGDGMTDVGYFDVSLKKVFYRASRSDQFSGIQELPVTFSFVTEDVQLQTGDFNGDGITDYILYNQIGNSEIAYSLGVPADLLTQVNNGIGGVTSIAYAPSKVFENAYLPFVIPVVVATTISNSRSYQVTTRYWYEGGLWKPEDREYYGFKTVRIYNAEDHYIQTQFSQEDLYLRGRPVEQSFFTKDGVMLQKTLHQWAKQRLSGSGETDVQFVYLKRLDQFEYDEHGQQKRRAVEYFYDEPLQLGNMTRMKDYGEVDPETGEDIGQDARWTDVQYVNRTDDQYWMIGYPREKLEYSYGKTGHNRKTIFFYDGLNGNIGTRGTLIAVWKLNEGFYDPSYTADFFDYDDYGNLIGIQIGGSRSEFVYDHGFHVLVIEQKDAEYQKTYRDYFGIGSTPFFGPDGSHGLFGQIKSETAVNEAKTFYNYDTFGRLLSVIGPRDTQEFPTVQMQYNVFADYTRVIAEKRLEHGTSRVVRSVEFSDGLGQVIQKKNPSGKPGRYIISGEKEYDQLGRIQRQFIAREALTAQDQLEDRPLGSAHVLFDYDALGRPLSVVNPDGTFSSYKYGLWETTAIDANGHQQKSYSDAFGNIIKREECRGADGRSVFYPKTPFQLYAVTQYFYNDRNQLTKTVDAHGNVTEILYDRLGNKIAMDDPDMGHWEYGYNESGDMVWQVDARGERTDFSYDNLHRLILKRNATDVNVTYTYKKKNVSCGFYSPVNNDGMLCRIQYGDQPATDSVRFFYDELGREIRTIKVIDGIEYRVDRGYDALNNLTEVHYPDGNAVYYYYDEAGRLERIANDPVMFDSAPALPSGSPPLSYHRPVRRFWDMLTCFYQNWFEPYILGISTASAQTTFQPAELVSPEISDVLTPGIMTFQWSQGAMADQYVLYVGSRSGWSDIYNGFGSDGLNLSAQVDIPIEKFGVQIIGEPIYVRLWSRSGTTWKYFDYVFQSSETSLVYVDRCMSLGKTATQYYLTRNLSGNEVTANCLNITAPDVTLDCQGHSIINHQLKSAIINSNQNGTTVQNCVVEPYLGTSSAEYEASIGILLRGNTGVIKKNIVRHAGSGIYVIGFNNLVEDNVVENTMKAIRLRDNNNTVKDNVTRNNKRGQGWGLEVWKGTGNQFVNNKSYGNTYGMILSYADSTSVRCNTVSGNSIKDLYIYNTSRNVSISGILPATRYVSPDSSMTFSADACLDLDCVWEGDRCVKVNAAPQVVVPSEKFVQSDQRMEFVAVATDADQDQLVIDEGGTVIPQGAVLETVLNEPGRLEVKVSWNPQRANIGEHTVVLSVSDGTAHTAGQTIVHVARGVIVEDPKLYVAQAAYNVMGQIEKIIYGTGTVKQYYYHDVNFRLERICTVNNQGIVIQDLHYQYDAVGNIISIVDHVNTATQEFAYDHLGRLIAARADDAYGVKTYQYDEIGNILEKDGKVYSYAQADSRTDGRAAGPHAVTSLNDGSVFRYDENGNMVSHVSGRGSFGYAFDAENRLSSVMKNGERFVDFRYDGDGGRTKKIVYGAVSGAGLPLAYPELLQGGADQNDLVTHFIGKLYEVDNFHEVKHVYMGSERILSVRDGVEQYIHGDHLGSANVVEDSQGDLVQLNEYQPFGEFSRQDKYTAAGQESDLYFTQQILDDETGLYYYGARYYDPALGRFISADSVVQAPMDPQTLNRYSYCRNNPVIYTDPSGRIFGIDDIIIGAIIGAVIGGISSGIQTDWNWDAVGRGALTGAVGGAVFAAVAPALNTFTTNIMRDLSLGAGASGPLSAGWSMTANFTSNFIAGAASGSSVMAINGGNRNEIGDAALFGGAFAGGFSVMRDSALLMRAKMVEQSKLDPRNASGKSVGFNGDGFKLGGGRYDIVHKGGNPSPLGGHQGGQGQIFGIPYKAGSFWDRLVEAYAGPHDYLNSWGYDQFGNLAEQKMFESFLGATLNPLNVVVATPVVAASVVPSSGYSIPAVIYGNLQQDEIAEMKERNN